MTAIWQRVRVCRCMVWGFELLVVPVLRATASMTKSTKSTASKASTRRETRHSERPGYPVGVLEVALSCKRRDLIVLDQPSLEFSQLCKIRWASAEKGNKKEKRKKIKKI